MSSIAPLSSQDILSQVPTFAGSMGAKNTAPSNLNDAEAEESLPEAGLGKADFSSKIWSSSGDPSFDMSTYTSQGTLVQVKAGKESFRFGKQSAEGLFKMAGVDAPMAMDFVLTKQNGDVETINITKSTRLLEDKQGNITVDDGSKKLEEGTSTIVVNLDDDATLQGTDGNDVLLNFARNATLAGGDGNDVLMSMGNNVTMRGGEGDDRMKVVRDVIRKDKVDDFHGISREQGAIVGFDKGIAATLDGGAGNDTIEAETKLENAKVTGGEGDDIVRLKSAINTKIVLDAGNDSLDADSLVGSSVEGGDGNDTIKVSTMLNSRIDAGAGDDVVTVSNMTKSSIMGGDGNDTITVIGKAVDSIIDGGAGNDTIFVNSLKSSTLRGGDGDDTISVHEGENSVIDAGAGNDTLILGSITGSVVMGGEGDDTVYAKALRNSIMDLGDGNDTLEGAEAYNNLIMGGSGNDRIRFETSRVNIIDGGEGDDLILAHKNSNIILGDNYTLTEEQYNLKRKTADLTQDEMAGLFETIGDTIKNTPLDTQKRQYYMNILEQYKGIAEERFNPKPPAASVNDIA